MSRPQSVLIVDCSEDNQEVLKTALERRGVRTLAARRAIEGLEMVRRYQPDVVVLDLELEDASAEEIYPPFERDSVANGRPLIILGSVRPVSRRGGAGEFVPKPYHYGPLIRRIEQLLERSELVRAC